MTEKTNPERVAEVAKQADSASNPPCDEPTKEASPETKEITTTISTSNEPQKRQKQEHKAMINTGKADDSASDFEENEEKKET